MKTIRSIVLVVILTALVLISAGPAQAGGGFVVVNRRDAVIDILSNGDVHFVETWEVDFQGAHDFTVAFRSIPMDKATGIVDWGVREAGRDYAPSQFGEDPHTFVLSSPGNEEKITWYFPETRNAVRTFELSYTVQGSLGIYDDRDRFFWKFIESDRGYLIASSNVIVRLPAEFQGEILEIASFENGQEIQSGVASSGREVQFQHGSASDGQEWEIGVSFSSGYVSAEPQEWQRQEDARGLIMLAGIVVSFVLFVGGLLLLYLIWYMLGRDQSPGVVADYYPQPPEPLSPAVAGTLLDEQAEMRDVLAALVDLARRGYLEIVEEEQAGFGKKGDFELVKLLPVDKTLASYEKELMKAVFHNQKKRNLSALRNKFYKDLPDIQNAIYAETVEKGYFSASPNKVRQRYAGLGFAMTAVVGLLVFCVFSALEQFSFLAICGATGLLSFPVGLMIISRWMPRKTQLGAQSAAKWAGFKRYLENIHKYTDLEQAQDLFETYLPFAIAFGLEKSYLGAFERVQAPVPTWYHPYGFPHRRSGGTGRARGSGAGRAPSLDSAAGGAFAGLSSMSTGFFTMLDSASSVFTSQPSSSSGGGGYSGGGFSGGGGGGGGSSGFG